MQVKNKISSEIISAVVAMLSPYVPDISPTSLITALQEFDSNSKAEDNSKIKPPYTIAETCRILAISRPTLYRLFEDGTLTKVKVRNSTRIPAAEVHKLATGA